MFKPSQDDVDTYMSPMARNAISGKLCVNIWPGGAKLPAPVMLL